MSEQPALAVLAFVAFVQLLQGAALSRLSPGFGFLFCLACAFVVPPLFCARLSGLGIGRLVPLCPVSPGWLALAALTGVANYWVGCAAQQVAVHLAGVASLNPAFFFDGQPDFEVWTLVFGIAVAAPFCEEFLFRGFFQTVFTARHGAPRALLMAAVGFAVAHLAPLGLLSKVEMGLVFGFLAWRSGSLWPAVVAHAANNLMALGIIFQRRAAADPGPKFVEDAFSGMPGWPTVLLCAGATAALLAIFWNFGGASKRRPDIGPEGSAAQKER